MDREREYQDEGCKFTLTGDGSQNLQSSKVGDIGRVTEAGVR